MSPGDFRAAVVQARLARMRELLADIDRLGAVTAEQLATDRFVRHVAQHVLVQLVQLAVAINSHVAATVVGEAVTDQRASFDAAADAGLIDAELCTALKPSVGMRNVVVHEYLDVDHAVVAGALPLARRDYARYVRSVAEWLTTR